MCGRMKRGTVTVEIQHQAGMNAANAVNMNQGELVEFDAFKNAPFTLRNIS